MTVNRMCLTGRHSQGQKEMSASEPKFQKGDLVVRVKQYDFTDHVPAMRRGGEYVVEWCGGGILKLAGIAELFDPRGFEPAAGAAPERKTAAVFPAVADRVWRNDEVADPGTVPEGTWHGVWTGYCVTWLIDRDRYMAATNIGVRGLNCPCVVRVAGGKVHVHTRR